MTARNSTDARTQYWKARIDAWQTSGQSQQAFCKSNDLNYPNFGYWLRKFRRRGDVTDSRRAPGFVPVVAASVGGGLSVRMQSATDATANPTDIASLSPTQLRALLAEQERLITEQAHVIAGHERVIVERDGAIADHQRVIADKEHVIDEQQKLLKLLEEQLRPANQKRFGASSEKLPFQGDFFDEAELEQALSDIEQALAEAGEPPAKPKRKPRKGFSDKLPRVRVDLPLDEADKAGASRTFFTKVKKELDIVPAKSQVIEYWQEKAVFEDEHGEQRIVAALRQPHPLGKCIASISLLAYILIAKYADALPLYRLEKILARYGGNISRTAMANWIIRLDDVRRRCYTDPVLRCTRDGGLPNTLNAGTSQFRNASEAVLPATIPTCPNCAMSGLLRCNIILR